MKVINVKRMKANSPGVYYCGRPFAGWKGSALANWHTLNNVCKECEQSGRGNVVHQRGEAKEFFKRDLWAAIKRRDNAVMWALYDIGFFYDTIQLGCWCKRDDVEVACHCDVIKAAVESEAVKKIIAEWMQTNTEGRPQKKMATDAPEFQVACSFCADFGYVIQTPENIKLRCDYCAKGKEFKQ